MWPESQSSKTTQRRNPAVKHLRFWILSSKNGKPLFFRIWIRALDAATAALDNKFAEDKAKVIFQPDVPEYFHYILDGVEPEMKERRDIAKIMNLLTILQEQMTLAPDARPAKAGVEAIRKTTLELIKAALAPVES